MTDIQRNKKILGVIGGLGPMASAYFLRLVTEMTDAATDQEHIEVMLHSAPQIPDRTSFIIGESDVSPLPDMLRVGRSLVNAGADIIAIPCITAHFFQKKLEDELGVRVINAIEEVGTVLKNAGITTAGVMATDGTVQSELFQRSFGRYGISVVTPDKDGQADVMHLIYENVKAGLPADKDRFGDVSHGLYEKGAEVIILGCTELSVLKRDNPVLLKGYGKRKGYLDVLDVLAAAAVKECGKLKREYVKLI